MVFYFIGLILTVIGVTYFIFPSKKRSNKYGYRTPRAKESDATFYYAQKIAARIFFLVGAVTYGIGFLLKKYHLVQFIILEILLIGIPIVITFYLMERKIEQYNDKLNGKEDDKHEIIND
ncbi:MAG: SdpI family protein [Vagococcus sp.]